MLIEDEVVDRTCRALERRGFEIVTRATSREHGYDIVASRGPLTLIIEAKGAGSSRPGSNRYGLEFNSGQVFDHVAKAVLKALRVTASGDARAGVALPDNPHHRREISLVQPALSRAGILVVWVSTDTVTFEPETFLDLP